MSGEGGPVGHIGEGARLLAPEPAVTLGLAKLLLNRCSAFSSRRHFDPPDTNDARLEAQRLTVSRGVFTEPGSSPPAAGGASSR